MGGGTNITAATDVPGGPVLAGDHRRRDRVRYETFHCRSTTEN